MTTEPIDLPRPGENPPRRTNEFWNAQENTRNSEFTDYFFRHGARMHSILRLISDLELPDGIELPNDRPIIFAANHRSFLDIVVAAALFENLQISCRFQVQARMFDRPVVGPWLTKLGCIPTNTRTREASERTSLETLAAGQTLAVAPEGRLVPAGDRPSGVGQARPGISRLAATSGAVVVPMACHGSDGVWPRGRPLPRLGLIRRRAVAVEIGPAMEFTHDDHQANVDGLMATIAAMLARRDAAAPRGPS